MRYGTSLKVGASQCRGCLDVHPLREHRTILVTGAMSVPGVDRKLKAGRQNDAIDPQETLRAITVGVGWARRPRRSDDGTASTPPCPRDWHSARSADPSAWAKADPK